MIISWSRVEIMSTILSSSMLILFCSAPRSVLFRFSSVRCCNNFMHRSSFNARAILSCDCPRCGRICPTLRRQCLWSRCVLFAIAPSNALHSFSALDVGEHSCRIVVHLSKRSFNPGCIFLRSFWCIFGSSASRPMYLSRQLNAFVSIR